MGENVNVGAGTITCNYDGYDKSQTKLATMYLLVQIRRLWHQWNWAMVQSLVRVQPLPKM